jgi:hypothetical protein
MKFCLHRVYCLPVNNKQETIELSFDSANHLVDYINDYSYSSKDNEEKNTYRKGEIRDTFSSVKKINNKNNEEDLKKLNKRSKFKLMFDIDKEKSGWLNNQIQRNGGAKDIMLAIQVVLQKNQKAFLRSWNIR